MSPVLLLVVASFPSLKKTIREIGEFDREARQYLAREEAKWRAQNPEAKSPMPASKFTWALQRMLTRTQRALEKHNELLGDLNIKHASEDKDGNIDTDARGQFKFKREALLERNKEQRALLETKTEVEPYYATELPRDLTAEDRETFMDFVIKNDDGAVQSEKKKKP